jgi:hypothetical protein
MNQIIWTCRALVICGLIILVFASISNAQIISSRSFCDACADTAINPHDFTNEFYASQGIMGRSIVGRRNGSDYLSTYGYSSNPNHSALRVLGTMTARGSSGEILFWYPLGELSYAGFTRDKLGSIARDAALASPLYVFPMESSVPVGPGEYSIFSMRQAAMLGTSSRPGPRVDDAGLHVVVWVNYTDKAFSKDGQPIMDYMMKKNGTAADHTPAILGMDDMNMLMKEGMISTRIGNVYGDRSFPVFALTPVIVDPTGGGIAPDAFLIQPMIDGNPIPSDLIFATQFNCLQKTGNWCME